ncbi:hypothetical protein B0H66DRAFT_596662 [Apodospora peruviana]|uniref:Beta-glucuronidase C-terminal domain-containing protein n=1 Tax=Apodospora peruviana TaxID=516989 RepID=A0AAE0IPY5_9PEZI|nr:hypothetical protein B0H66DRAFT_596662 [Apodospora peruviana]
MKKYTLFHALYGASLGAAQRSYVIKSSVNSNEVLDGFVSFSIEFSSFPDFAALYNAPLPYALNGTRAIKALLAEHCPELVETNETYGYLGPLFAGVNNRLKEAAAWAAGINADKSIKLFSTYNYISGSTSPGVTLQGTLMNHTTTKRSVDAHITEYNKIKSVDPSVPPLIFGEANSLYNQGKPGLSNSFGAALWSSILTSTTAASASNASTCTWAPTTAVDDSRVMGTRALYYGNIAVAAMMGNLVRQPVSIVEIPLADSERKAAYAAYTNSGETLVRFMVINLNAYNTTVDGAGQVPLPDPAVRQPAVEYRFTVPDAAPAVRTGPDEKMRVVKIQRLLTNGSDAITGITWDGWSYNYELAGGKPATLGNVTVGETVEVCEDGNVNVTVPWSSAALLDFSGCDDHEGDSGGDGDVLKDRENEMVGWD